MIMKTSTTTTHEDDDSDSVNTTPGNPLLEDNVADNGEGQDEIPTGGDETQRENGQAEGSTFDAEGVRHSTRVHRAPSSYIPSRQGNKYQSQGTVNLNVPDGTNYRKFAETD